MSKVWKDSPKPLRPEVTDPIFVEVEEPPVVKAQSDIEYQRSLDGSLHSMNRPSALRPRGMDLYISSDKVEKSANLEKPKEIKLNVESIVKSFMEYDFAVPDVSEEYVDLGKMAKNAVSGLLKSLNEDDEDDDDADDIKKKSECKDK